MIRRAIRRAHGAEIRQPLGGPPSSEPGLCVRALGWGRGCTQNLGVRAGSKPRPRRERKKLRGFPPSEQDPSLGLALHNLRANFFCYHGLRGAQGSLLPRPLAETSELARYMSGGVALPNCEWMRFMFFPFFAWEQLCGPRPTESSQLFFTSCCGGPNDLV